MNLEELQVEIRARTPGETVAMAARMLQVRPGPHLAAWAFSSAGTIALGHLLLGVWGVHWGWALAIIPLLAPVLSLPMIATVGHLVFSPKVSFGTVAATTIKRGLPYLLLFIINRLLTLIGLAVFIVPGLYLWRASWFLGPIVALEGSSMGASFRRGRRFAAGFHGHVASHAFNAALLVGYLTLAFVSLVHLLVVEVFGLTFDVLAELPVYELYPPYLVLVGFALALPFCTLAWFFVYLDVRIRKEGWDLELSFRARAAALERSRA